MDLNNLRFWQYKLENLDTQWSVAGKARQGRALIPFQDFLNGIEEAKNISAFFLEKKFLRVVHFARRRRRQCDQMF